MPAYSLIQFTAPSAVSRDRRTRLGKVSAAYADAHGLTLDKARKTADGAFRSREGCGPTSQFLRAVEAGSIPAGSTLLAESLEGIYPANLKKISQRFADIIAKGITVVTFPDQVAHDVATLAAHPERLPLSLIAMAKAQEDTVRRRLIATQYRKMAAAKMARDDTDPPQDLGVSAYRGARPGQENPPTQSQGSV